MVDIGSRIRAARKSAGLSQEELARRADLSLNGVAILERGKRTDPHVSTVNRLAGALGVPAQELLGLEDLGKAQAPISSTPAEEAVEGRRAILDALKPLLRYIEQRAKEYEEELKDENGLAFRTASTAILWTEMLNKEAQGLSTLLIEEAKPYLSGSYTSAMTAKEKLLLNVDLLRPIATLFEARKRADRRIAKMPDMTDDLAKIRRETNQKARLERQRLERQLKEIVEKSAA